jgi:hypothetical protein
MLVMPDADLDQATDALMGAAYGSAGERCMAVSVAPEYVRCRRCGKSPLLCGWSHTEGGGHVEGKLRACRVDERSSRRSSWVWGQRGSPDLGE